MLLLMLHLVLHLILNLPDWLEPCTAKLIPRACGSLIYGILTVLVTKCEGMTSFADSLKSFGMEISRV